jgi:hypothetical protein
VTTSNHRDSSSAVSSRKEGIIWPVNNLNVNFLPANKSCVRAVFDFLGGDPAKVRKICRGIDCLTSAGGLLSRIPFRFGCKENMFSPCRRELSKIPVRMNIRSLLAPRGMCGRGFRSATGNFHMSSDPTYSVEFGIRHKKRLRSGHPDRMPLRNLSQL